MFGKRLYHRSALVSGLALAGLLFGTGARNAVAAEVPTTLREHRQGIVATASADACTPAGTTQRRCRSVNVEVFDGTERSSTHAPFRGTRVCVSLVTYTTVAGRSAGYDEEQGCASLPVGTLQVAPQLARVRLPATSLTLERVRCTSVGADEAVCEVIGRRQATIGGTWTATSRLISGRSRTHSHTGACVETREEREQRRETTAQLTLDGQAQPAQSSAVAHVFSHFIRQCR